MSFDNEQIIISILEESPIYSALQKNERHIVIEELKKAYSNFLEVKHKNNNGVEDKDDWFRKRL